MSSFCKNQMNCYVAFHGKSYVVLINNQLLCYLFPVMIINGKKNLPVQFYGF